MDVVYVTAGVPRTRVPLTWEEPSPSQTLDAGPTNVANNVNISHVPMCGQVSQVHGARVILPEACVDIETGVDAVLWEEEETWNAGRDRMAQRCL